MIHETANSGFIGNRWAIGILIISIALGLGWLSFFTFARDRYSEYQIERIVQTAFSKQRPGGGRLFGAKYGSPLTGGPDPELGRAQVLLLSFPPSESRVRLQGMVYLATAEWKAAADTLAEFLGKAHPDAATVNNLGVTYLALADTDATYLLKALDQLEEALKIAPRAPEPLFNLIITYRKLQLSHLAEETRKEYAKVDPRSKWISELDETPEFDESKILDELRQSIKENDITKANWLFDQYPELCRRVAMQYGLKNISESEALVRFIAKRIETRYGDKTISAMLLPLETSQRETIIAARDLVQLGAELYLRSNIRGSLDAYDDANKLLLATDSAFDQYWIDINKVDTQIRAGEFDSARTALDRLISGTRERDLRWLLAKGLTIYGSTGRLSPSYAKMMELTSEAERIFRDIGALHDTVRPLYYLAGYTDSAGDHDESLRLALKCLYLTDRRDVVRLASLYWLLGSILYRKGLPPKAALFEVESVAQAEKTKNPVLLSGATSMLALLYESISERHLAEKYLTATEDALERIPQGFERMRAELLANLLKGRIYINRKRYEEAEATLRKNLDMYSQPLPRTAYLQSPALMLLARVHSETGRIDEARREFSQAIDVVENDDQYLKTEKLRLAFDDERRELYDSAIAFEYDHAAQESAWGYLQKYRAKIFLEFLAQFDPRIEQIRSQAHARSSAQKLIPEDTQVIEYVLLKDRLIIWLMSDKLFTSKSVPIPRAELEGKVQGILARLRKGEDVDQLSEELGKLLIEPVESLLDPSRTVAIIPDRALHGLPFAALRVPGKNQYLIQQYPIIVSPSLTHLLATNAARPKRDAIVSFGSQNDDSSETRELTALRGMYPKVTTYAGQQVDKPTFLAAMNTAPIFHYAGHSATDAVDPLRSSILLDGNRYGPNSVTAVDIAQRRLLNNAVVVLSSCDSSVGNSRDGVGMRGLTSAFLIGGAGSVVGSLWPVEASSTSELMIRFHRGFATSQMPVAKALRNAQLTFIERFPERSHPYYWSGFVVTGNFSALR